jgi:hypothetical protein
MACGIKVHTSEISRFIAYIQDKHIILREKKMLRIEIITFLPFYSILFSYKVFNTYKKNVHAINKIIYNINFSIF